MKLVRVDLERWRRSRRRSTRFMVGFFAALALAWPLVNIEFVSTDAPLMEDVTFKQYHIKMNVDSEGTEESTETVVVNFNEPSSYVRSVGELAATDKHVRYYSEAVSASIDGEEADIKEWQSGVGGHYYSIGENLTGTHTIIFTYRVKRAIIDQDGEPTFRARLLPRATLSQVADFRAEVTFEAGMVTEDALCWTTDDAKPVSDKDKCEFEDLTPNLAIIDIENPSYLRPVRFTVPVKGEGYTATRLPWSGYWDSTLGRHAWTPIFALLLTVGLVFGLRRYVRYISDARRFFMVLGGLALAALLYFLLLGMQPSIGLLPFFAVLWVLVPVYLRLTEPRLVVKGEELEALKAKAEKQAKLDAVEADDKKV